jgi:hypothetical protein
MLVSMVDDVDTFERYGVDIFGYRNLAQNQIHHHDICSASP